MPVTINVKPTNSRRSAVKASKTATREPRRPAMTAADALNFEATSSKSAEQVLEAIDARREAGIYTECACEPYSDVLTFRRWLALGRFVRRGETALRVNSYVPIEDKKAAVAEGEAAPTRMLPKVHTLFCKCQTDEAEPRP